MNHLDDAPRRDTLNTPIQHLTEPLSDDHLAEIHARLGVNATPDEETKEDDS